MIKVTCPDCGEGFAVHPAMAGKPLNCPKCKAQFQTAGKGGRVVSDDYTGVVQLGVRKTKGGPGKKKVDPKVLIVGGVILLAVGLALYFLVFSGA